MFRKRNLRPTLVGCGFRQPVLCYVLVGSYIVVLLYSLLLYCFLKTIHENGEGGHDAKICFPHPRIHFSGKCSFESTDSIHPKDL